MHAAGAVNRLAGRFAKACAVPFEDTDLPRAVVTGNPVRDEILSRAADRDPVGARAQLDLPEGRFLLAVFAGSLGARRLNAATTAAVSGQWAARGDLVIHHVVGARDWDDEAKEDVAPAESSGTVLYNPVRYEQHMELVLDAADLVVCRSGGSSVAELAVMGTPAILVPLPIATRDHQRMNAAELVGAGAAVLIDDEQLDAERLVAEVDAISSDPGRLARMSAAARGRSRPDAADAVADLMERHAG